MKKGRAITIGTRDSALALWQANNVQNILEKLGHTTRLLKVKSTGDLELNKPLYEMGITGIFTKTLDIALLKGTIDIAVHSMKDVPTLLPKGIVQSAVLKRGAGSDVLVYKGNLGFLENTGIIATGSLRRSAQWLHKFPNHQIQNLRGNVNTRLKKLSDNKWDGAIFAKTGLDRINLLPQKHIILDWMIPAPAQGAMVIMTLDENEYCKEVISELNHHPSEICTAIEREFLSTLEGGCTAPIGAVAILKDSKIEFTGGLFSLDGTKKLAVTKSVPLMDFENLGKHCAIEILENGGAALMTEIKKNIAK